MDYAEQLATQREHARDLVRWGICQSLTLVRVEYPNVAPRVSIIGHAISRSAPDAWRAQGATVTELEVITA